METKKVLIELTDGETRYLLKRISVIMDELEKSKSDNSKDYEMWDNIFDKLADGLDQLSQN